MKRKNKSKFSLKSKGAFLLWSLIVLSLGAHALDAFNVSNKDSHIAFAGEHAGMKFSGVFEKWEANLLLPPAKNPKITATFDLGTAKTGDFTYDSTLSEGDWFDVKNHPIGRFESDSIAYINGQYEVSGNLTLRGISKAQHFILKPEGDSLKANFSIKRLDYRIGLDSDPNAEWVSKEIEMTLSMTLPK